MINNVHIYNYYWFISNHNMGCVSILTFQNVIHPQTAVLATEIPPGRSSRRSWQPGATWGGGWLHRGKGNPSNG